MVKYTLTRKTGGGQTFQTEGRAYESHESMTEHDLIATMLVIPYI